MTPRGRKARRLEPAADGSKNHPAQTQNSSPDSVSHWDDDLGSARELSNENGDVVAESRRCCEVYRYSIDSPLKDRLESLLLQAEGLARLNEGDFESARELFQRGAVLAPSEGCAESLFHLHLSRREYDRAEAVLSEFRDRIDPWRVSVLDAVLNALAKAKKPSAEILETLKPREEARWGQLYLGILQRAKGDAEGARSTLHQLLESMDWRAWGRDLAVELMLEQEVRACGICDTSEVVDYAAYSAEPLCKHCHNFFRDPDWMAKMVKNPDELLLKGFSRLVGENVTLSMLEYELTEHPECPVEPFLSVRTESELMGTLSKAAGKALAKAEKLARPHGGPIGTGDLGVVLVKGSRIGERYQYREDKKAALKVAQSLEPETSSTGGRISDQLCWLLNVALWIRRFESYEPENKVDVDGLFEAYAVVNPGPWMNHGTCLVGPMNVRICDEQAQLFTELLDQQPNCPFLRNTLAHYYDARRSPNGELREQYKDRALEHKLWLLRNYPYMRRLGYIVSPDDQARRRACLDTWCEVVRARVDEPAALGQAAEFFAQDHPSLRKVLLERCHMLEPNPPRWVEKSALATSGLQKQAWSDSEFQQLAGESLRLLEQTADSHADVLCEPFFKMNLLTTAYHSGEATRTREVARQIIASQQPGDPLHFAFTVLGLLALEDGDVSQGAACLLKSAALPKWGYSFAPCLSLSRELWKGGDKGAVERYLDLCRERWPEHQVQDWLAGMKNALPDFSLS